MRTSRPLKIAVVAFDGITPFHLSVPSLVFGSMPDTFEVRVCGVEKGMLRTTAGFSIAADCGLALLDKADIVIV
ncbi:MAG TPA: GlxA family transcriptional regulator, partial [Telluria sp.]|nr:GlxA family transcriptional regulator [Telluria sp.]